MKILSGRQPWWWLLLNGKTIENRGWNTKYRGPILLHASKVCSADEYATAITWVATRFGLGAASMVPPLSALPRGGIVGRARIVDVVRPYAKTYPSGVDARWHMREQFGFVLEDAEPVAFVPWKGALSLFDAPAELVAQIRSAA